MSTTRHRQNSSVSKPTRALSYHTRQKSRAPIEPKSAHVSDPFLQSFLSTSFDPAAYLNSSLPSLQPPHRTSSNDPSAVSLAELSAQAQDQLTQLNAHTTRLTNTLTQLTDDILRSGSRLAYEVELLRGETLSLTEALTDGLRDDIAKFVPGGLQEQISEGAAKTSTTLPSSANQRRLSSMPGIPPPTPSTEEPQSAPTPAAEESAATATKSSSTTDPVFISQLQTLTLVRSRLDDVVKTFGDAMEFVFPPSEVSVSSSFLSVSAPEPGSADHSTEEKGQRVLKQFRDEITELLAPATTGRKSSSESTDAAVEGIEKAARRIEELKELNTVWKGTAEEKGRTKFVDGLAKMVEDRHQELLREMEQTAKREGRTADAEAASRRSFGANSGADAASAAAAESKGLSGYGLMSQLQRLRNGL
ncbi:hypothetical protein F5Y16DRAFT_385822 [Xylariaceae sp. FL0255]|nr:hypothetical protein F5Y16DRAFT_385822 [Xylariaceae sp. FL0255]